MVLDDVEILLVEDDPSDAELTIRALRKRHMANRIYHARDGAEAVDFLFARGTFASRSRLANPKVVLLDLKLPKLDGSEVLRRLKADDRTKAIPVVVLTSSQESADLEECYALGVNSFVVKPVDFDQFAKTVAAVGYYWMLVNQKPT